MDEGVYWSSSLSNREVKKVISHRRESPLMMWRR